MYPQTLYPKTKQVLEKLKNLPLLKRFYLAGGTALALQLGHRKSQDLDFFTSDFPKRDLLLQALALLNPKIIQEAPGTIDLLISGIKVSFLEYNYPVINKFVVFEKVNLASVVDIACMKLSAISSRGSKKDFIDLYEILKKSDLKTLFTTFEKKFKNVKFQKLHLLKSICFFADADKEPDPQYLKKYNWQEVKNKLQQEVKNYLKKL